MQQIKKATALALIDRYHAGGKLEYFSLTYVTSKGKLVTRNKMSKATGARQPYVPTPTTTKRQFYNVKEREVLVLFNHDLNRVETPNIFLLTHFNGERIWH